MFFDFGIKGGFGFTWLYNDNIMNDTQIGYSLTPSYLYGGKISINFNEKYAICGEFLSSTLTSQAFKFNDLLNNPQRKTITFKQFSIPVLFRYNGESGGYMEIGPQFNTTNSVHDNSNNSISDKFVAKNTTATFGFGQYFLGAGNFYGTFGFRFNFGVQDILTGAGGKDKLSYYPLESSQVATQYKEYKGTIPISVMFMLEFNYDLGYFAKSKCKRRAFMMF